MKVLPLIAMVIVAVVLGQEPTCQNNRYNNGCTIPLNAGIPFRNSFRPACAEHDICYKCGNHQRFSINREACDNAFLRNMRRICRRRGLFKRFTCETNAHIYFLGVRVGGIGRMKERHRVPSFCADSWVDRCIP